MMKNDHFYWKNGLGHSKLNAFWLTHYTLFIRFLTFFFIFFHGVIVNYPNTLVLTSALQVMHIHVTLIYFHNQGYNISSILSLLLHYDTVADMTL